MNHLDYMSTYQYSTSRHHYHSHHNHQASSHPFRSIIHSRALTELQFSKPGYLINHNHDTSSSFSSLQMWENPFANYLSLSMYENRPSHQPKENPFLTATPYRFCRKEPVKENGKGLAQWEKKKYLEMYGETLQEETRSYVDQQPRIPIARKQSETITMTKKDMARPIRNEDPARQPDTFSFRRQKGSPVDEPPQIFMQKSSPIDLKSKFSDLQNEEMIRETPKGWTYPERYQKVDYKNNIQVDRVQQKQEKEENSLIHKLTKTAENKHQPSHLKMTNSHVQEFQYNTGQLNPYITNEIPEYNRENEYRESNKSEQRFNFEEKDKNQVRQRPDGVWINQKREFPQSLMYKYAKYDLIKII